MRSLEADEVEEARSQAGAARAWLNGDFAQRARGDVDPGGEAFVLRFAAHNPATAFLVRTVYAPAFEVLKTMSRGRLVVQPVWAEKSHKLAEGWRMIREGKVEITPCYSSRSPELKFNLFQGLYLPGLFPDAHVGTLVSEMLYRKYLKQDFDAQSVRMGRLKATGSDVIFSKLPITCLEQMHGLRVCAPSGWHGEIYRMLGAEVLMKPPVDIASALASDELDAVAITDGAAQVFGIDKVAKYRLSANLGRLNLEFCISPSTYDVLPFDLQSVLSAWFSGLAQAECQIFYGLGGAEARRDFANAGMKTVRLTDAEQTRWSERNSLVYKRFSSSMAALGEPADVFMTELTNLSAQFSKATQDELMLRSIETPVLNINAR